MAEELTALEFVNKGDNLDTLIKYSDDRNLEYETAGDVMKNFLSDYRGLHTNTIKAASFIGYVNQQEDDSDYKNKLGELYKSVDDELESQITGDDVSFGERARGVGEYVGYAILDPINLLGFGAGKAIAMTAGRVAVKGLVNQAFGKSLTGIIARNPLKSAALGAAAPELIASPTMDYLTQTAEKDLKVRDEIDAGRLVLATGIGMATAGAFGVAGEFGTQYFRKKFKKGTTSDDVFKQLESSEQGQAGAKNSIKEVEDKSKLRGIYVNVKPEKLSKELEDGNFDPMGRITEVDGDNITVEFLTKTPGSGEKSPTQSILTKTFNSTDLKALSEKSKFRNALKYRENDVFMNRDKNAEVKNILDRHLNKYRANTLDPEYSLDLTPDQIRGISSVLDPKNPDHVNVAEVITRVFTENRKVLTPHIDLRVGITEQIAAMGKAMEREGISLPAEITNQINKLSKKADGSAAITPERFFDFYRNRMSVTGIQLAENANIQSIAAKNPTRKLTDAEKLVTDQDKDLARLFQAEDAESQKAASIFSDAIDVWRATLIMQPATTLRNVFGSLSAVPGISLRQKIDTWFIGLERDVLGLEKLDPKKSLEASNSFFDLTGRLMDRESSVALVDFMATLNDSVKKSFNDNFGDRSLLNINNKDTNPILRGFQNAARRANFLNIAQDRGFKSAAFLSSLQAQINRKRNLGAWDHVDNAGNKITSIEQVLGTGNLNLLDETMINNSIKAAYEITFQSRNAGDKLFGPRMLGLGINWLQRSGANTDVIKLFVPFANFMANMFVYSTQRMGGGAIKFGSSTVKVLRAKGKGGQLAKELNTLKDQKKLVDSITGKEIPAGIDPKYVSLKGTRKVVNTKQLDDDIKKLELSLNENMTSLVRMKEGLQESIEMTTLISTAVLMRILYGGDKINEYKNPDTEETINAEPLFPLPGINFVANAFLNYIGHEKGVKVNNYEEFVRATTGYSGRAGVLKTGNNIYDEIMKIGLDKSYSDSDKFGKAVGSLLGQFLAGPATPARIAEDVWDSTGGAGLKKTYETRRKTVGLYDEDIRDDALKQFLSSAVDEMVSRVTAGTRAEDWLYEGTTPERRSITEGTIEKKASVPVRKQTTGAVVGPARSDLASALAQENVPEWELKKYSEVKVYDTIFNKIVGEAAKEVSPRFLSSESYVNAPRYTDPNSSQPTKSRQLINLYTGSAPVGTPIFRAGTKYSSEFGPVKSLFEYAKKYMDRNHPGLSDLSKYRARLTKENEANIEKDLLRANPIAGKAILKRVKEYGTLGTDTSPEAEMQLSSDVRELIKYRDAFLAKSGSRAKSNMEPLSERWGMGRN
tara:strand:- start:5976 stop:9965 length:3990 start_codon:yes stop_codon:yes gene_type:complete